MRAARFSGYFGGGMCLPGGGVCPEEGGPCEQNDWQTGVKTLPCPKLRLRAVMINMFSNFTGCFLKYNRSYSLNNTGFRLQLVGLESVSFAHNERVSLNIEPNYQPSNITL